MLFLVGHLLPATWPVIKSIYACLCSINWVSTSDALPPTSTQKAVINMINVCGRSVMLRWNALRRRLKRDSRQTVCVLRRWKPHLSVVHLSADHPRRGASVGYDVRYVRFACISLGLNVCFRMHGTAGMYVENWYTTIARLTFNLINCPTSKRSCKMLADE